MGGDGSADDRSSYMSELTMRGFDFRISPRVKVLGLKTKRQSQMERDRLLVDFVVV